MNELGKDQARLYRSPFLYFWPHVTTTLPVYHVGSENQIAKALERAAIATVVSAAAVCPNYRLFEALEVDIPFRDRFVNTVGSPYALKLLANTSKWDAPGPDCLNPTRKVKLAVRLPLLVRFQKDSNPGNGMRVWMMTNGIPSDGVNYLPEFAGSIGKARYDLGYELMAAGLLSEVPLTQQLLNTLDSPFCIWVSNQ